MEKEGDMKVGVRKPSIKKSVSARTTGRVNRSVKSAVNPTYGKKGMGMINDPKKAAYNKIYNKTTVSATKGIVNLDAKKSSVQINNDVRDTNAETLECRQSKAEFEEIRAYVLKFYPWAIAVISIYNIVTLGRLLTSSKSLGFWGWIFFLTALYSNRWFIKTYRYYKNHG